MRRVSICVLLLTACGRWGFDDATAPADDTSEAGSAEATPLLTVQLGGGASGTVVGPNGFTCAGGTCTLDVEAGTAVTLRGLAATNAWFNGWTGPCGGNFNCELVVTEPTTVLADFTPTPNRVFVTSTTTTGGFGGVTGGDLICKARATAAGLDGNFIAYLSDGTNDAASRVNTSRGWVRVDGAPFADAPSAFSSGEIVFPPRLDEYGQDLGPVSVYTGTDHGNHTTDTCQGWTSSDGADTGTITDSSGSSDSVRGWGTACTDAAHLLCVEVGRTVQVEARVDTGKLAFMTRDQWYPGGGLASADAHCASEAASAALPGTFLAALATTTASLASRFPADAVYRRTDGVRLLRGAGLFEADAFDVAPERDQIGEVIATDFWTGAQRFATKAADAAENCSDWTDATPLGSAVQHWSATSDVRSPAKTEPCTQGVSLLCLEQ